MPQRRPRSPARLTRERAAHRAGLVCPHSLYHHDADTLAPALIELVEGIAAEPDSDGARRLGALGCDRRVQQHGGFRVRFGCLRRACEGGRW